MHSLIRISLARLLFAAVPLVLVTGNAGAKTLLVGVYGDNSVAFVDVDRVVVK